MADKQVFQTMNGLRGIAALVVVAYHWSLRKPLHLANGFLAVDFFFVLSGFVIAYSYEQRLKNGLSLKDFTLIRLIRFYPLYFLGIAFPIFTVILSYVINGRIIDTRLNEFRAIPFELFMLPSPPMTAKGLNEYLYLLNSPAWSLFFEMIINLLYAASVRFWTELRIVVLLTVVGSVFLISVLLNGPSCADGGWNWATLPMGFLRVLYSFPAGVLIYRLYDRGVRFKAVPSPVVVALLLILFMAPPRWGVPFSVLAGFPLLVALAAKSEPRGLLAPVFASLGVASYAIYVIHQPMHDFITAVLGRYGFSTEVLADVILLSLIVPVCVVIDTIYDIPVRKYLTQKLLRRTRQGRAPIFPARS